MKYASCEKWLHVQRGTGIKQDCASVTAHALGRRERERRVGRGRARGKRKAVQGWRESGEGEKESMESDSTSEEEEEAQRGKRESIINWEGAALWETTSDKDSEVVIDVKSLNAFADSYIEQTSLIPDFRDHVWF